MVHLDRISVIGKSAIRGYGSCADPWNCSRSLPCCHHKHRNHPQRHPRPGSQQQYRFRNGRLPQAAYLLLLPVQLLLPVLQWLLPVQSLLTQQKGCHDFMTARSFFYCPQYFRAISCPWSTFAHCSSSLSSFPPSQEAKPH